MPIIKRTPVVPIQTSFDLGDAQNPAAQFPFHFNYPEWNDRLCEGTAEAWVRSGAYVPEWRWPVPGPYNGASGEERIRAWQLVRVACNKGLMPQPKMCSVCGVQGNVQYHNENYFRPLNARPICNPCHRTLHRRFRFAPTWRGHVNKHGYTGAWFLDLPMRELTREEALRLAEFDNPFDLHQIE